MWPSFVRLGTLSLEAAIRLGTEIRAAVRLRHQLEVLQSEQAAAIEWRWLKIDRESLFDDCHRFNFDGPLTIDGIMLRCNEHTLNVSAQRVDDVLKNIRRVIFQIVASTK